jgi:hypothetical protein
MSEQWYLYKDSKQYGPYSWDELTAFAHKGRVVAEDYVWHSGMTEWTAAGKVAGLITSDTNKEYPKQFLSPNEFVTENDGEKLLSFIENLYIKTGKSSTKKYTIAVTNKRLIFAELTEKMLNAAADEAREESKGKGFFSRWWNTMGSDRRIFARYYLITPEEILKENPGNFAINNMHIKSVTVLDFSHRKAYLPDEIIIETAQEKYCFYFLYNHRTAYAKQDLQLALGDIVRLTDRR